MEQFMPHGYCMMWNGGLVLLHVVSDVAIALAYFSIPLALLVFVRQRRDVEFGFLFWLFSMFIFSCGVTHLAAIVTLWRPDYWMEGWLKALTAVISVITAVALWLVIPKALRIPSPKDLRRAKEELEISNQDLRETNVRMVDLAEQAKISERTKDEFLATTSHELRTPMNSILGFTDLLRQEDLSPQARDHVETIQRSAGTLLRIINDILDMSGLLEGQLQVRPEPMSPTEAVADVEELLRPAAQEAQLALRTEVDPALPACVLGDQGRIRQILLNLAGNSLKHSGQGTVTIAVRQTAADLLSADAAPGRVSIDYLVSDTGRGISPEAQETIFQPFQQVDSSLSRRGSGTGLGLTISRRLAELMGGSLTCQSVPGQGATFTFRASFPVAATRVETSPPPETEPAEPLPLRILMAEDDSTNRKLITLLLNRLGFTPSVAVNGAKALELYRRDRHDCVLMDLQMPEMDGITSAAAMRAIEAENPGDVPAYIIALTANVLLKDRLECLAVGMNELVPKPLKPDSLRFALQRVGVARLFHEKALEIAARRAPVADLPPDESDPSAEVIHQIVYISRSVPGVTERALPDIIEKSHTDNAARAITGVLLYGNGEIIQILEGEKKVVQTLFGKIAHDPRHDRVIKLHEANAPGRNFAAWHMGLRNLDRWDGLPSEARLSSSHAVNLLWAFAEFRAGTDLIN